MPCSPFPSPSFPCPVCLQMSFCRSVVNIVSSITKESSGLFSVKSELSMKVVKEDKDDVFYCEISFFVPGETRMTESNRINITVYCELQFLFKILFLKVFIVLKDDTNCPILTTCMIHYTIITVCGHQNIMLPQEKSCHRVHKGVSTLYCLLTSIHVCLVFRLPYY